MDTISSARKPTESFVIFAYSLLQNIMQSFKIKQNLLFFKTEYFS